MNSEALQESIQTLEQKLRGLLVHYKQQQEVLQQLQKENAQRGQNTDMSSIAPPNFSNSLENGTITDGEERVRALDSSIDRYIRDIDKSIAYLEQLR